MRSSDAAGQDAGARSRQRRATSSAAFASCGEDGLGRPTSSTTTAPADRPVLRGRRRDVERRADLQNTQNVYARATARRDRARPGDGASAPPENRIRVTYYEGSSVFGNSSPYDDAAAGGGDDVAARRASRCASSSCAGTSTAGTTTARAADATSAARLDANGNVVAHDYTVFAIPYYTTTPSLAADARHGRHSRRPHGRRSTRRSTASSTTSPNRAGRRQGSCRS